MANNDSLMFQNWVADMDVKAENMDILSEAEQIRKKVTVHKVPTYLREVHPKAFTPVLVSFGPYHHGNKELQLMGARKEQAVVHFIRKVKQPLNNIVQEIRTIISSLQEAYSGLEEKWNDDGTFMKMMILDGCFMLDQLWFVDQLSASGDTNMRGTFINFGIIKRDMLLIENQLPLILLKTLVNFQTPRIESDLDAYVNNLLIGVLAIGSDQFDHGGIWTYKCLHALDLFRETLSKEDLEQEETDAKPSSDTGFILTPSTVVTDYRCRCAVELQEAGIRFRLSRTTSFNDVHFNPENGTFHLPLLVVDDHFESIMLNTMAFEQLQANLDDMNVTSYLFLMDEIIDTAKDVRLLRENNIILNSMGDDENVAALFNRLTDNLVKRMSFDTMIQVRKDVSSFCGERRNKWRAILNHTYFGNPWSVISVVGAALIILLTFIQTICAIIQM